jgi:hypothetical protein
MNITASAKICPTCGVELDPIQKGQNYKRAVYCSRQCAGVAQRKHYLCKRCGQEIEGSGGTRGGYCSQRCYWDSVKGTGTAKIERECAGCGATFMEFPSQRQTKRVYCSRDCFYKYRPSLKGANNPAYKGGTAVRDGYVVERGVANPARQHKRVAEEMLGRKLESHEHVHHINGQKSDNRPENLMVLSPQHHLSLHQFFAQEFVKEHNEKGDLEAITRSFLDSL